MDDEEDGGGLPFFGERRKLFQVPRSPIGDRIGKHGHPFADEGAGLDLEVELPAPFVEKKVEPAPPDGHLGPHNPRSFKPRHPAPLEKGPGHVVVPVGVEHDGTAFPLHCHDGVTVLPLLEVPFLRHVDGPAGEEKLMEPSGVGEKGAEGPPLPLAPGSRTGWAVREISP